MDNWNQQQRAGYGQQQGQQYYNQPNQAQSAQVAQAQGQRGYPQQQQKAQIPQVRAELEF